MNSRNVAPRRRISLKSGSRRDSRQRLSGPLHGLALVTAGLVIAAGVLAIVHFGLPALQVNPGVTPTTQVVPSAGLTDSLSPSLSPTPAPWLNPILIPSTVTTPLQKMGTIDPGSLPSAFHLISGIFDSTGQISNYLRPYEILFGGPLDYNLVPGVLTFRGNNFRSSAAFGLVDIPQKIMAQVWERPVGSLASSSWSFTWTGTGWTGQPDIVQWDWDVQQMMNLYPDKKAKHGLKEVIYATMDGNIYFFDLDDGKDTRPPIHVGASIKGTPAIDPRGYPILYVGQGDFQPPSSSIHEIGYRIYSLIDQKLLYFQNGIDQRSYRPSWGACDSSPIVDANTDTLIYPNENGMIYTLKLNTVFDRTKTTLTIDPESVAYRYRSDITTPTWEGIESSACFYGHYAFFSDNAGALNCMDLDTMTHLWTLPQGDDSDATPTLDERNGVLSLYSGTEVGQQSTQTGDWKGTAFLYRVDALSGKVVWKTTMTTWTKTDANMGNDIKGGIIGSPVVGKGKMADLVVYSFSMTTGIYSGDSLVAFNKDTGAVVWTYKMKYYSWSSPVDIYDAAGNPYLVIYDSHSQIHLLDGMTGAPLDVLQLEKGLGTSKATNSGNIESSPAIFGNQLVIGTRGQVIVGVTLK